jgi:hypothetical protein
VLRLPKNLKQKRLAVHTPQQCGVLCQNQPEDRHGYLIRRSGYPLVSKNLKKEKDKAPAVHFGRYSAHLRDLLGDYEKFGLDMNIKFPRLFSWFHRKSAVL